jgi:hypothetical protein
MATSSKIDANHGANDRSLYSTNIHFLAILKTYMPPPTPIDWINPLRMVRNYHGKEKTIFCLSYRRIRNISLDEMIHY